MDLAHSLVETRLISPSSLDASALASASAGSPINKVIANIKKKKSHPNIPKVNNQNYAGSMKWLYCTQQKLSWAQCVCSSLPLQLTDLT